MTPVSETQPTPGSVLTEADVAAGWKLHDGGPNPVPGQRVNVMTADGWRDVDGRQSDFWDGLSPDHQDWWKHKAHPTDKIIAYRLSRPQPVSGSEGEGVERGPITHDLKCWPEPFAAVKARLKPWELRKNDRDYRVGDTLRQREWSPDSESYTGDVDEQVVTWALYGPAFGLPDGYVIMSIRPASHEAQAAEIADLKARNKALEEGVRPFAEASESLDPDHPDACPIWEAPAAMGIDARDLRRARTLTEADHGR